MTLSQKQKDLITILLHRLAKTPGLHEEDYNISVPEVLQQIEKIVEEE